MGKRRFERPRGVIAAIAAVALGIALSAIVLGGCQDEVASNAAKTPDGSTKPSSFPVTVTDDTGRRVTMPAEPRRIVSLAPASTEIVYAIGLGDRLVGVTTYDDYPADVKNKPKVGDFMNPNLEAIAAARPDLVLATSGVQADVVSKLEATGAKVLVSDPKSLDECMKNVLDIGSACGAYEKALGVQQKMHAAIEGVRGRVPEFSKPVSCFIEIAQNPLYTAGAGTLLGSMIAVAEGRNVVTKDGYVAYSTEQLVKDDPAVYLATRGSMSDPKDLSKRPGYAKLSAVRNGRVYVLDDNLVSRPGPRIVEGLAEIAKALHPDWYSE